MLRGGISIGKVFGISLRLHYSWFFIFALITWTLAAVYFPTTYPDWSLSMKIGAGLVTSFLFFGSVLSHELCHSLVALREGIKIRSITLFFLGGVAQMTGEPKTAADEFRMAAAGPFSSLVLGGIFLGISYALNGTAGLSTQFGAAVAYYLGFINIFLAVFNLVPGFPLDGGRILRSIIWWRSRNLQTATRIASYIGRAFGFLFIGGGIYLVFTRDFFDGIWLAIIGLFLQSAAAASYQQLPLHGMLSEHTAGEIMSQDCVGIPPDITVERLVNENMLRSGRRCFPVVSGGHVEGFMTLDNVKAIPGDTWSTTQVRQVMTPLDKVKSVSPNEDLNTVLQIMAESNVDQVPVVWENKVAGIVSRDNIINFISIRAEIGKR